MQNQNYFSFIKWYYKLTSDKFFSERKLKTRSYISKKGRILMTIIAYLLFITSFLVLFLSFKEKYISFVDLNILSLILLSITEFSFTYYAILYRKSKQINRSLNDNIIVQERLLYKQVSSVRNIISKHCNIFNTKGNIFCLKYCLENKKNKQGIKYKAVLKIKPNKITINKTVLSNKSLTNLDEFKELIKNNIEKFIPN